MPKKHPCQQKKYPGWLKKTAVIFFWLAIWQLVCLKLDNPILLVGPAETVKVCAAQLFTPSFWQAAGFSFGRICLGFFLAFFAGLATGTLSCRFRLIGDLLELPIQLMKAIPVASFVILALIWTGSRNLSVLISFAVVYPMIHISTQTGVKSRSKIFSKRTDKRMIVSVQENSEAVSK